MLSATMAHAEDRGPEGRDAGHASQARHQHRPHSEHRAIPGVGVRLSPVGHRPDQRKPDHAKPGNRSREAVKHTVKSVRRTAANAPIIGKAAREVKALKRLSEVGSELKRAGGPVVDTASRARHAIRGTVVYLRHLSTSPVADAGSPAAETSSPSSHSRRLASERPLDQGLRSDANRQAGQGILANATQTLRTTQATARGDLQTRSQGAGGRKSLPLQSAPVPVGDGVSQGQGTGVGASSVTSLLLGSSRLVAKHRPKSSWSNLPTGPTFPPSSSPG
jgi:hypothetical protein